MSTTMPSGYYNRTDEADNYEKHLFIAGRGLQSAELNEIQDYPISRLRKISDAIFKDGDIVRDASVTVNYATGATVAREGALYINGAVRGVAPRSFTIPINRTVSIGIILIETVLNGDTIADLKDPASGTRLFQNKGADRLKVDTQWAYDDEVPGASFYPVYVVENGVLQSKEAPPQADSLNQAIAKYDRDSSVSSYVVSGMTVAASEDVSGNQVYTVSEGRARVNGYGVEFKTSARATHDKPADLRTITSEPHLSTSLSATRYLFNEAPAGAVISCTITKQRTVTITHGAFVGALDNLPDTSVLAIVSVVQGGTTYVQGTSYQLTSDKVDWSLAGIEPATGSTYTVVYNYIATVTPTAVDQTGFTVTGALVGSLILVTYQQMLPRLDVVAIDSLGFIRFIYGASSANVPLKPLVPTNLLELAVIYQTWGATRKVDNIGVRVVSMSELNKINGRLDYILGIVAQQQLTSDVNFREIGLKKGIFVDPFTDDSLRDAGTAQTASVFNGAMVLPLDFTALRGTTDVSSPVFMNYLMSSPFRQDLITGSININAYGTFPKTTANATLTPSFDNLTDVVSDFTSDRNKLATIGWWQNRWSANGQYTANTGLNPLSVVFGGSGSVIAASVPINNVVEHLRQITVNFRITGFLPNDTLFHIRFDGIFIPFAPTNANANGVMTGSFTVPANILPGSKSVIFVSSSDIYAYAIYTGRNSSNPSDLIAVTNFQEQESPVAPLAQTFTLPAPMQSIGVKLYIDSPGTKPIVLQIRTTDNGIPTNEVIAECTTQPIVGDPGSAAYFTAPVYFNENVEYAIVLMCDDPTTKVNIAQLGKFDTTYNRWVTSQPYQVGTLLTSSNGNTWTANQDSDLSFVIRKPLYSETVKAFDLGDFPVTEATDLIVRAKVVIPNESCSISFALTMPDASVITVTNGQYITLPAAVTGNIGIVATLTSDGTMSPILYPGTQLIVGVLGATGTYVSRSIPAGTGVRVKAVIDAIIPSGSSLLFEYSPDDGSTWVTMPSVNTLVLDNGMVELTYEKNPVTATTAKLRITATGTPAARPVLSNLRFMVIA